MDVEPKQEPIGWWLIFLDEMGAIYGLFSFSITILSWLAAQVSRNLNLPAKSIRLRVTIAEYVGKYPCLGATSTGDFSEEDANLIEEEIRRVLKETSVQTLLRDLSLLPGNNHDNPGQQMILDYSEVEITSDGELKFRQSSPTL